MLVTATFAGIAALPAISDGTAPDNGIWLQTAGNQCWAYYPYYGNLTDRSNYSAMNTGTSFFTVKPGTSIYRKIIVQNKLSFNITNVGLTISGLPPTWVAKIIPPRISFILSGYVLVNGTWVSRPTGNGAGSSPQGFSGINITIPLDATAGSYPYTILASTYDPVSGKYYNSTLPDAIIVGAGATITPTPEPPTYTPTPEPPRITPTPTPTPDPVSTVHEGFDNGYDKTVWTGSKQTNYKNDLIVVDHNLSHDGNSSVYGITGSSGYARAARNVTYGGHGFEFSAWFYLDANEPGYPNSSDRGTSLWAGVMDCDNTNTLELYNGSLISQLDNRSHYRVVGYNNRTEVRKIGYHVGDNNYKYFDNINTTGWYRGVIKFDGTNMTFEQYDVNGSRIGSMVYNQTGFVPKSIMINAGSRSHRIDDINYTTW